jgi:hypothetical protein
METSPRLPQRRLIASTPESESTADDIRSSPICHSYKLPDENDFVGWFEGVFPPTASIDGVAQKIVLRGGVCGFGSASSGVSSRFVRHGVSKAKSVSAAADQIRH